MKVVKLTESDLRKIVKKVLKEQSNNLEIVDAIETLGFHKKSCPDKTSDIGFEWCHDKKPHVIIQYKDGYLQLLNLKTLEKWPDEVFEVFTLEDLPDLEQSIKSMM